MTKLKYERDVDLRSVTLHNGIKITFSDYNTRAFSRALDYRCKDTSAHWMRDAWNDLNVMLMNNQVVHGDRDNIALFLLGEADDLSE